MSIVVWLVCVCIVPPRSGGSNKSSMYRLEHVAVIQIHEHVMYSRNDDLYIDTCPSLCGRFVYALCPCVAEVAIKCACIDLILLQVYRYTNMSCIAATMISI